MFRYTKATALREGIVWVVALLTLLPFYFLIATALKPDEELLTTSTAQSASVGSASQVRGSMPTQPRTSFSGPVKSKMNFHT